MIRQSTEAVHFATPTARLVVPLLAPTARGTILVVVFELAARAHRVGGRRAATGFFAANKHAMTFIVFSSVMGSDLRVAPLSRCARCAAIGNQVTKVRLRSLLWRQSAAEKENAARRRALSSPESPPILHGNTACSGGRISAMPLELCDAELATAATACRAMRRAGSIQWRLRGNLKRYALSLRPARIPATHVRPLLL